MADGLFTRILRRLGHAAEPLLAPDAPERRRRDAATERRLKQVGDAVARLSEQVGRVTDRVDRFDRRQVEHLGEAVAGLRWSTRRQAAFAERLLRSTHLQSEHEFMRERAVRRLRRLAQVKGTIVVGPWTGEVGYELLYWVPFVRWALETIGVPPERVVLVSRGGTASWYGLPDARYVDVLSHRTPEQLRLHMAEAKKQRRVRAFDRRLLRDIAADVPGPVGFLHPALMYALYLPYWKQVTSIRWVEQFASFARVVPPPAKALGLPDDYVAVRFYFSDCFPETEANRAILTGIVSAIAAEHEVVVLGSGVRLDDHHDAAVGVASGRVHTIDHLLTPETNLAVQTAVIGGARAFIGTYGGFSYLAPLCGVPTLALYSERNYYGYHLDFAQQVLGRVDGGSLTVMDTAMRHLAAHVAPLAPVEPGR